MPDSVLLAARVVCAHAGDPYEATAAASAIVLQLKSLMELDFLGNRIGNPLSVTEVTWMFPIPTAQLPLRFFPVF